MNFAALLQAAEYLEREERLKQHEHASPTPREIPRPKSKSNASQENKMTHNVLEGNRRAHMRICLEKLRNLVPLGKSSRHTTLGLLIKTQAYIKALKDAEVDNQDQRALLLEEQRKLRCRLNELLGKYNVITVYKIPKVRECNLETAVSKINSLDMIGGRVVKHPGSL